MASGNLPITATWCHKCHRELVRIGLHIRCLGCGEGILEQSLKMTYYLGIPLSPKRYEWPPGYIEGEEWVNPETPRKLGHG